MLKCASIFCFATAMYAKPLAEDELLPELELGLEEPHAASRSMAAARATGHAKPFRWDFLIGYDPSLL